MSSNNETTDFDVEAYLETLQLDDGDSDSLLEYLPSTDKESWTPTAADSPTPSSRRSAHIRHMDERFETRFSYLNHTRSSYLATSEPVETEQHHPWDPIRWAKLRKISGQVFSEEGARTYGTCTCLLAANLIAIGTSKGLVLVFDHYQNLKVVLGPKTNAMKCGEVTALAFSADKTCIAVGHTNGHIFSWDLSSPFRYTFHVHAISPHGRKKGLNGHMVGSKVIHLSFLGKRHSVLIAGDVAGMAFVHTAIRTLVGRTVDSHRIIGRYPDTVPAVKPTTLLACAPLPSAKDSKGVDNLSLVAVLTPNLLALISVSPSPTTEFKTGRPKSVSNAMGLSGSLAWFPALHDQNPRLAYCWSNVLTVMEVSAVRRHDGVKLSFTDPKRYVDTDAIVSVQWLSDNIIALVTITQYLLLVNYKTLTVSAKIDLANKHIQHFDYFSKTLQDLTLADSATEEQVPVVAADGYFNSVRGYNGKIFLMGSYELAFGSLRNWADNLLDNMESGNGCGAIDLAISYYRGVDDPTMVGLPVDEQERKDAVSKNMPEMIVDVLRSNVKSRDQTEQDLANLTKSCLEAWIILGKPDVLFEAIFECFQNTPSTQVFFDVLADLISQNRVTHIGPGVFRELIKRYVAHADQQELLEELVCRLDLRSMDVDLAITLCKEHGLRDPLVYIWNQALKDYITPLVEFLEDLRDGTKTAEETGKVYPYISYLLTGRMYPTGLPFENDEDALSAKNYLYFFIFNKSNVAWPQQGGKPVKMNLAGGEYDYPYLFELIRFDSSAFFSALNEAFEDPFLNDSANALDKIQRDQTTAFGAPVTRQSVLDTLFGFYELHGSKLSKGDKAFFAIFVARNYPKYLQFISISPHVLFQDVFKPICECASDPELKPESELALEALSSVYRPTEEAAVQLLTAHGLLHALASLYTSEHKHAELVAVLLDHPDIDNAPNVFDVLAQTDSATLPSLLTTHFKQLADLDPPRLAQLVSKSCPAATHNEILKCGATNATQLEYLGAVPKRSKKLAKAYQKLLEERSDSETGNIKNGKNDKNLDEENENK